MIRIDRSADHVLTITLDRPDKANALTAAMLTRIADAIEDAGAAAEGDRGAAEGAGADEKAGPATGGDGRGSPVRALILTGAGRVFSAGADLDEAQAGLALSPEWERLSRAIAALPCPTVAALNGTVAGGATGMVLACDLRIAVPEARFFYPVMRLGFLPQPSDPGRLVRLIGRSRAAMILLAGQRIGAAEALAWGLIDRIVPPEALAETARALVADSLAADPAHAAAIKQMIADA